MSVTLRLVLASLLLAAGLAHGAPPLGAYGIRLALTSVSGMSAGAAMAEQFAVAHSSIVVGKGLVAPPPYFCAGFRNGLRSRLYLANALSVCMNPERTGVQPPEAALLWGEALRLSALGAIDDVRHLARQQVYVFSGLRDRYIARSVADQTARFQLLAGVRATNIVYSADVAAGHGYLVDDRRGVPCGDTAAPFINDCRLAQAHLILRHAYRGSEPLRAPPALTLSAALRPFDQRAFARRDAGLADTGYVYVPARCKTGGCKAHVVFHGCRQSAQAIGTTFATLTGYNQLADSNGIVVLYPQVRPDRRPYDPFGCWDFWGYAQGAAAGPVFHTKRAPQIAAVRAMLERLAQTR